MLKHEQATNSCVGSGGVHASALNLCSCTSTQFIHAQRLTSSCTSTRLIYMCVPIRFTCVHSLFHSQAPNSRVSTQFMQVRCTGPLRSDTCSYAVSPFRQTRRCPQNPLRCPQNSSGVAGRVRLARRAAPKSHQWAEAFPSLILMGLRESLGVRKPNQLFHSSWTFLLSHPAPLKALGAFHSELFLWSAPGKYTLVLGKAVAAFSSSQHADVVLTSPACGARGCSALQFTPTHMGTGTNTGVFVSWMKIIHVTGH